LLSLVDFGRFDRETPFFALRHVEKTGKWPNLWGRIYGARTPLATEAPSGETPEKAGWIRLFYPKLGVNWPENQGLHNAAASISKWPLRIENVTPI
jgi:hypothetical protein